MSVRTRSASRRCCSTPAFCRRRNLKPASPWRRRRAHRGHGGMLQWQSRAHLDRKCPLVCRPARRAARGCGLGPAQSRHCLWRRQFRHRRFGRARLRSSAGRSARSGRSGDPRHRRRQRAIGLIPSRGRRLGPHLVLSVRRTAHARRKRTSGFERMRHPPWQDRPLADRDRRQGPHGRFERARADGGRRRLSGPVHHRLGVRLPDRAPSHDSRPAGHCANHFGPAWITGVSQYMLDPADPWPSGYRLSDTWSRIREAI
jgi:hypothetical protein